MCDIILFMEKIELKRYIADGKSISQIANLSNRGRSTVRYWLKKYELTTVNNLYNKGNIGNIKPHLCSKCGESDPDNFYGHKRTICGKCHNQYTLKIGQDKRLYAINKMGGKCVYCGYNKYSCSLDIHHLDPSIKSKTFPGLRSWSFKRIDKEIENCVLLCKNCHSAYHAGYIDISGD